MTPFGHYATSYLFSKTSRRFSSTALIIGGLIPDIDWILYPFQWFNEIHRVVTHNIFFVLIIGLVLVFIFKKQNWKIVFISALIGGLLHLFIDSIHDLNPSNGIGVALFYPLSNKHYSLINIAGSNELDFSLFKESKLLFIKQAIKAYLYEFPFIITALAILILRKRNKKKLG